MSMTDAYARADELMRKGRYTQAIDVLRELLSAQPENGELRSRVGEAYRLAGNMERAFHHFNKGAAIAQRAGDIVSACRMLKAANTVSPNEPDILFRMAECMRSLGLTADLDPVLRQLITVARGSGDRRRLWALEELSNAHPGDLDLSVQYASALGEAGRIDEAVTAWKRVSAHVEVRGVDFVPMLRKAAEIAAERPDVGVDLADILLVTRRPRDALSLLVPFYEKFPEDIGVLGALVRALEQLGAIDKVVPARIELIKTRVKRGHRELAFQEVTRLIEVAPDDPLALEVSAHTYAAFGFKGDAAKMWRRLAKIHDETGNVADRDRAIMMLLKLNPDDQEALALGARSLYDAGRVKEAQALSRRLSEIERKSDKGSMPHAPMRKTSPAKLQPKPRDASDRTVLLIDDDAIEEVFDNDDPPEPEQMPIAPNPYIRDLELELPTKLAQPLAAEYNLPEENVSSAEETTSKTELAALRRAFEEEDVTHREILTDEDPTLPPPPDDFDDFTSKTRSQLMSELHKATSQGGD
jgi:Flp pilus assembly protein TadD